MSHRALFSCLALTAAMLPIAAQSVCPSDNTIFACTTTKGKFVEVCDSGKVIRYIFGRRGQTPELSLSVPRESASTFQWAGIGRHMHYSVTIPNGNTHYRVFSSVDRLMEDDEDNNSRFEAGIAVEVDGRHVVTVDCVPDTVTDNLEGIDLKPDDDETTRTK